MSEPKLHHYVPRFYIRNFVDAKNKLWIYDKITDRIFRTTPNNIAAENQFYRLPDPLVGNDGPLAIEKALAHLESRVSVLIKRIVSDATNTAMGERIILSDEEKKLLSEFISVQCFRTRESRDLLQFIMENAGIIQSDVKDEDNAMLYFTTLGNSGLIEEMAESIYQSIWLIAKNASTVPFITSDHPVCVKSNDSRMWIKGIEPLRNGSYIVFPISPQLILYCHEASYWDSLQVFNECVSPVELDEGMVHQENCGQAFAASRFLMSYSDSFQDVREFIPTIGTDTYAPEDRRNTKEVQHTATFNNKRRAKTQ